MITEHEYQIFQSKMNKDVIQDFEILESIATFSHKIFLDKIKDGLLFYEMTIESLSISCNISQFRLSCLLNGNANFEPNEIQVIKRRLHI